MSYYYSQDCTIVAGTFFSGERKSFSNTATHIEDFLKIHSKNLINKHG